MSADLYEAGWDDCAKEKDAEIERLHEENAICRNAIEEAVALVTSWCQYHDSDMDAGCGNAVLRRLGEAIGKATPRLLMEKYEGQKFYGLLWREKNAELDRLRGEVSKYKARLQILRGLLLEILPHLERGQPTLWKRVREALGE